MLPDLLARIPTEQDIASVTADGARDRGVAFPHPCAALERPDRFGGPSRVVPLICRQVKPPPGAANKPQTS
jgi:hypothetical protein